MNYNQSESYAIKLAGELLKCCENKSADFLNTVPIPYYTQDVFSKQVLNDAAQLRTLLNNAALGYQYINYAPTFSIQDSKQSWMKNEENKNGEKKSGEIGCIVYKGKDDDGNKHYEMMSPAKKLIPIQESPMSQDPIPNVGVNRQAASLDVNDPKGIEKYLTAVMANYFNAAFTKTPYFAPQWGGRETFLLANALNADPSMALRVPQQAFSQAVSVKLENTVNQELNDNVMEAIKQGLPPFNTKKQDVIIGPVNINGMGALANGVLSNGVDFVNSFYNGKNSAEKGVTAEAAAEIVAQNGYVPYQTHNEKPKNIDNYLIEQYSNIINASLTGTPYSGSVTPAQLKAISSGIEAKIASDPSYLSGIVNKAQQNVAGLNYLPFDKDEFITKARDPASKEFKLLDQVITNHINDISKNNKTSFNGEFQKLSGELTEKIKKTTAEEKKPSTKTNSEKKASTPSKGETNSEKKASSSSKAETAADETKKTSAKTNTAKKSEAPSEGKTAEAEAKKPSTKTNSGGTNSEKKASTPSKAETAADETKKTSAKTSTAKKSEAPLAGENTEKREERPSFFREATEFVKKNIIERKPALVLVDTFLGTLIDKAKKIVRTNQPIAAAIDIAATALAPNSRWKPADYSLKFPVNNQVSINVNREQQTQHRAAARR